ncbi:hypothetical protein AB4Z45_23135 [Paenibacillus sp. MCAF9]|uniref:hypothetical protein n=1 Tax=unclassified Paenibacillus TaxID=185978 RepID=UPI003F9BBAE8
MGTFLSNIQVFTGVQDSAKLLEELVLAVRNRLVGDEYEETDSAESADRSLILQISSDRWISVYDQRLDEQDMDALDALGTSISASAGVPAIGSLVHDSDLFFMRLYRNGRMADTIINDLNLFNEMFGGSRPRKRNGLPSKWAEVCATGVNPAELKAIWEKEMVFAEEALALAAELLDIPADAAMRGYETDSDFKQETKVIHLRSKIRFTDHFEEINAPKLAFSSWNSFAAGDAGILSKVQYGLINQGQAFTGLDVLLWGPALEERLIELGAGILICTSNHSHTRPEWNIDPQPYEFEVKQSGMDQLSQIKGYRYEYPEMSFPDAYIQMMNPETAAKLGLMRKWMDSFNQNGYSFQLSFTGKRVGKSDLFIAFLPREIGEGQLVKSLPVFIGVKPDKESIFINETGG